MSNLTAKDCSLLASKPNKTPRYKNQAARTLMTGQSNVASEDQTSKEIKEGKNKDINTTFGIESYEPKKVLNKQVKRTQFKQKRASMNSQYC